jgi:hypothetical protein
LQRRFSSTKGLKIERLVEQEQTLSHRSIARLDQIQ